MNGKLTTEGPDVTPSPVMGPAAAVNPELELVRERHRRFYLDLVEQARQSWGRDPEGWHATLSEEQGNIRRALSSAVEAADTDCALRLCTALAGYWSDTRLFEEGSRWFGAALALPSGEPRTRAAAHIARGRLHSVKGRYRDSLSDAEAARSLYEGAGDKRGVAHAESDMGWAHYYSGNAVAARDHLQAAVDEREHAETRVLLNALRGLGWMAMELGDLARGKELFEDAIALADQQEGSTLLSATLVVYSNMLARGGAAVEADDVRIRLLPLLEELGDHDTLCAMLLRLHRSMRERGRVEEAAEMLDRAAALAESGGVTGAAEISNRRARLALAEGRLDEAARLAQRALAEADPGPDRSADDYWAILDSLILLAEVGYREGRRSEAGRWLRELAQATAAALAQTRSLEVAYSLMDPAFTAHHYGDRELAEELSVQAEALVSGWEHAVALAWTKAQLARIRGRPDVQRQELDRALNEIGEEPSKERAHLLHESAALYLEQGRPQEARAHARAELDIAAALGLYRAQLRATLLLATAARLQGGDDELEELNDDLVRQMAQHPTTSLECPIAEHLAVSASRRGRHSEAVELISSVTAATDPAGPPRKQLDQMEVDEVLSLAKRSLEPSQFAQSWSRGKSLPVRKAVLAYGDKSQLAMSPQAKSR